MEGEGPDEDDWDEEEEAQFRAAMGSVGAWVATEATRNVRSLDSSLRPLGRRRGL